MAFIIIIYYGHAPLVAGVLGLELSRCLGLRWMLDRLTVCYSNINNVMFFISGPGPIIITIVTIISLH